MQRAVEMSVTIIKWDNKNNIFSLFLGLGLLGGFFLLLLLINDVAPPTASSSPLITVYVMCNMIVLTVAMLMSVVISYIHDLPENKPMPKKLSVVSRFCCYDKSIVSIIRGAKPGNRQTWM